MNLSEEAKPKLMVVAIVAMLAVTMIVAGYRDEGDPIKVVEGFDETNLEYLPEEVMSENYPADPATALTSINNESYIELHVVPRSIAATGIRQMIRLVIIVEGMIDEELEPEYILLENEVSRSFTDFMLSDTMLNNESISEYHPQTDTIRRVGSYIHTNEFVFETLLQWDIYPENWGEPLTLELKATLGGLSEEVPATVNIHIE